MALSAHRVRNDFVSVTRNLTLSAYSLRVHREIAMHVARNRPRVIVDIAITITTVLESCDARVIDLTEQGAQIAGATLPRGAKFQIEYMDQTIYAQCMWSEIDRMGVRFPFDLTDGPLHDALMMAPTAGDSVFMTSRSGDHSGAVPRRAGASFGRRTQH
jgi:hypothetical protein